MKRMVRSLLVLTVLLVVAQPMFACLVCNWDGRCVWGAGPKCKFLVDGGCTDGVYECGPALTGPLAADYSVASVEISHESDVQVAAVTKQESPKAPAAVAEARIERIQK